MHFHALKDEEKEEAEDNLKHMTSSTLKMLKQLLVTQKLLQLMILINSKEFKSQAWPSLLRNRQTAHSENEISLMVALSRDLEK